MTHCKYLHAIVAVVLGATLGGIACRETRLPVSLAQTPSSQELPPSINLAGTKMPGCSMAIVLEVSGASLPVWDEVRQVVIEAISSSPSGARFSLSTTDSQGYVSAWPGLQFPSGDTSRRAEEFLLSPRGGHGQPQELHALRLACATDADDIVYFCTGTTEDIRQAAREMSDRGRQRLWLLCPQYVEVDDVTHRLITSTGGSVIILRQDNRMKRE